MAGSVGNITTDITREGLIFNMDAANRGSIAPSSTVAINTINPAISGTFENTTAYDTSLIVPTFDFDGVDAAVNCGNNFNIGDSGTDTPLSCISWIYPVGSGTFPIISRSGASSNASQREFYLTLNSSRKIEVWFYNTSGNYMGRSRAGGLNQNEWHCVGFTYDGSKASSGVTLYLNGVAQSATGTDSSYTGMSNAAPAFRIGAYTYSGANTNGNIGSVQLYNRALLASEMLHNYNTLKGRFGL